MTPAEVIGSAIRTHRWHQGWTIEGTADAAGLSHVTWRRLERGQGVRQHTLTKLEDFYDLERGLLSRALNDLPVAKLLADRINGVPSPFIEGAYGLPRAFPGRGFVAGLLDSPEVQAESHAWDISADDRVDPPESTITEQWDTPTRVLGRRVRELREKRQMSVRDLAGQCFRIKQETLTPAAIEAIEAIEYGPVSLEETFALAYALDVAVVNLIVPLEPRDDVHRHRYWIAPDIAMSVNQTREWVRGNREWLRGRLPAAPGVDPIAYLEETPPVEWVPKERSDDELAEFSETIRSYRRTMERFQPSTHLLPDAENDDSDPEPVESSQRAVAAAQRRLDQAAPDDPALAD